LNCSRTALIVHFLRQKGREMQIRSKAYKHFISICRSFRDPVAQNQSASTSASPSLAYAAAVLALLLTILEIDLHRVELRLMGLMGDWDQVDPLFFGP
jgi:hypothetical protein